MEEFVAPVNVAPLKYHWNIIGVDPEAATRSVTVAPRLTDRPNGWTVIIGGAKTESAAARLQIKSTALLIQTW
jgi:hypothetical protein